MTAKDFNFIAQTIADLPRDNKTRYLACQHFADNLRIVNPRFNERLFMDACEVQNILVPARRITTGDTISSYPPVATFFRCTDSNDPSYDRITFYFKREDGSIDPDYCLECDPNDPLMLDRYIEQSTQG